MAFFDTTDQDEAALANTIDEITTRLEEDEIFADDMIENGLSEQLELDQDLTDDNSEPGPLAESDGSQVPHATPCVSDGDPIEESNLEQEDDQVTPEVTVRRRTEQPLLQMLLVHEHERKLQRILDRNDMIVEMLMERWQRRAHVTVDKEDQDKDLTDESSVIEDSISEEDEDRLFHKCQKESRAIVSWFESRSTKD